MRRGPWCVDDISFCSFLEYRMLAKGLRERGEEFGISECVAQGTYGGAKGSGQ